MVAVSRGRPIRSSEDVSGDVANTTFLVQTATNRDLPRPLKKPYIIDIIDFSHIKRYVMIYRSIIYRLFGAFSMVVKWSRKGRFIGRPRRRLEDFFLVDRRRLPRSTATTFFLLGLLLLHVYLSNTFHFMKIS